MIPGLNYYSCPSVDSQAQVEHHSLTGDWESPNFMLYGVTPRRLTKRKTIQTIVNTEEEHHSFAGGWDRFRAAFESTEIQKNIEFLLVLALNLAPLNPQ